MLIFKSIKWKNLLSTGNAWTEIQLDRNADTLIVGENGSGKSTILDAICIALFNRPFRNINKPTLVNSINKSDLLVEVIWTEGVNHYRVVRGIKPAIFEIYRNGVLLNQDAKAKDYQDHLEKYILKFNFKSFTQIAILGSASFVPFMQLKAFERRQIIEDLLDIQIFSSMNIVLKKRMDINSNMVSQNANESSVTRTEYDLRQQHFDEMRKDKQKELLENEEKIKSTKDQIDACEARIQKSSNEIERLNKELLQFGDVKSEINKHENFVDKIQNNIIKFGKEISFWSNTTICPTCDGSIEQHKAHAKIEETTKKKVASEDGLDKLAVLLTDMKNKLVQVRYINEDITKNNTQITSKNSEIKILNKMLRDLEKKQAELNTHHENLGAQQSDLDNLQTKLAALDDARKKLLEESEYLDVAGKLLRDNGIKTKIVKQYLPVINKLVNKYLAAMDFFVNFELNEQFEETIKSRYRDDFSYENFSEGEKQRIDMALLLTWREVAKMKNSLSTNLLILDEIFDSSMDTNGMDYLMNILHSLEKCNLFVISHKGDVIQDKFSHIIRFEKHGNYSRIAK